MCAMCSLHLQSEFGFLLCFSGGNFDIWLEFYWLVMLFAEYDLCYLQTMLKITKLIAILMHHTMKVSRSFFPATLSPNVSYF